MRESGVKTTRQRQRSLGQGAFTGRPEAPFIEPQVWLPVVADGR